jgi:hypothetical protein
VTRYQRQAESVIERVFSRARIEEPAAALAGRHIHETVSIIAQSKSLSEVDTRFESLPAGN